jgi:hypothetical protein
LCRYAEEECAELVAVAEAVAEEKVAAAGPYKFNPVVTHCLKAPGFNP